MKLLFLFLSLSNEAYYITERSYNTYVRCDQRDDIIEYLNTMDLSLRRLPEILIDEDLEMECNELPMYLDEAESMKRSDDFPYYQISSNKTDGRASFTLDTSSDDYDNCPGFKFSNIDVIFKGETLSTGYVVFSENTTLTVDRGFHLDTVKAEMPISHIASVNNFSFCRLILKESDQSFLDSLNITSTDDLPMPELHMKLSRGEANMFDLSIASNTSVLFDNNTLSLNFVNDTQLIVSLPEMLNYSNAFYFRILKNDVTFSVSGDINYTDLFPHYFFFVQDFSTTGHDIYFGPGNYLSSYGINFGTIFGARFGMTLIASTLHWNNEADILSLYLYDVVFYPESHINMNIDSITLSTTFSFSGSEPIQCDLNLVCTILDVDGVLRSDNYSININTTSLGSYTYVEGNVYLSGDNGIPSASDIYIENLTFVDNPIITYKFSTSKFKVKNLYGKFQLEGLVATTVKFYTVINVENIESVDLNDISFIPVYHEYQTLNISNNDIGYYVLQRAVTTLSLDVSTMNWPDEYIPSVTSITFRATANATINLSCIVSQTKVMVSPSRDAVKITFIVPQEAADNVIYWGFGSTTGLPFTVAWNNSFVMKNEYFSRLNCLMDPSYSLIDFSEIQSFTIDHFSQLESMKEFINNIPLIILLFDKLTSAPNLIKYVDDGWIYETVDESGEIYGINHNNISVKVSQTDKNTGRLILDMQTTKPSMLYIYASYTTSRIIELQGRWDEVTNFYPILFNGNLRLETPFEVIPILFDDRIWELDRNKNSNDFYVNRTKMQSITLIKSTFYKLYSMTFNTDNDEQLYIEILSDATVGGLLKTIFRNKVTIRLRQKLIIKDGIVDRFWSESNEILLYGTSTFTSPNYLDDLSLVWNYTDGYVSPPKISNIHSIASVNILFIDDPSLTLEEQYIDKLYRHFLLANAKKQINCDELLSKLYFPNGINLTYANDTILFQFICDDLIFTTEPYQFDLNGLVVSTDPYTIGLYINGTDHIDEVNDDGFEYEENNESENGVIVGICMSAVVITLLGAGITVYFVNRRKERIDPEQKKLIVSK